MHLRLDARVARRRVAAGPVNRANGPPKKSEHFFVSHNAATATVAATMSRFEKPSQCPVRLSVIRNAA